MKTARQMSLIAVSAKLLLISSNSSGRGGGERYLVFLAQGLRELGCEVQVLLSTANYMDGWAHDLAAEGALVCRRNLKGLRDRPLRFLQSTRDSHQIGEIADVCRSVRPSAIVVNQQYDEDGLDYLTGALEAAVATVAGVMHMPMTRMKNRRRMGRLRGTLLAKWYRHHSYHAVFVSEGARREFEAYYENPRPTYVVNNGIPFDDVRDGHVSSRLFDDGLPTLGFVGQLVKQKNLPRLVESWLEVRRAGYECRLLIVGDGPERASLEKVLWRSAPPGTWHITGWTTEPEVWLEKVDVFVLASHFEGLSLSLLEAAGRGIPAVVAPFNGASDVAARADWVRIAESNGKEHLVSSIVATLRQLEELKRSARMGGEVFRRQFSTARMAQEMLDVLGLPSP